MNYTSYKHHSLLNNTLFMKIESLGIGFSLNISTQDFQGVSGSIALQAKFLIHILIKSKSSY